MNVAQPTPNPSPNPNANPNPNPNSNPNQESGPDYSQCLSACAGESLAPTAAAMTACAVRMPSSPPKMIVFTCSPPC
eukprot:scaffold119032_cov69-Phaeocystis_antarctica.AAC.3